MIKYPIYVTIDTNIFDSTGYDLSQENTLGRLLTYVQRGQIKIVLSNIVIGEMNRHIQKQAYEIARRSNKLLSDIKADKLCSDNLVNSVGMGHLLKKVDRNVLAEQAKGYLDNFIRMLDVEVMDSSKVDVEQIFKDYFSYTAPFEDNDKKRKEFPDAFIAAQIRNRFANKDLVAIVSTDNGFKKACGKSEKMLFFNSLKDLYNMLSKEEEAYTEAVFSINRVTDKIGKDVEKTILENDNISVAGISCDKDGIENGYHYDETYVEHVSDMRVRIHTVDEIKDNQVYATLLCTASIQVSCYFSRQPQIQYNIHFRTSPGTDQLSCSGNGHKEKAGIFLARAVVIKNGIVFVPVTYFVFDQFSPVKRKIGNKVQILQFFQYFNCLTLKTRAEPFRQFLCGTDPFSWIDGIAYSINTSIGCTEVGIAA